MLRQLFSLLWSLVMLPIKLLLLPFKIASAIISIVIYGTILLVLGLLVFLLVL